MKLLISFLFLLFTQLTFAQDAVIAVGTAEQDLDKLVIDDPSRKKGRRASLNPR